MEVGSSNGALARFIQNHASSQTDSSVAAFLEENLSPPPSQDTVELGISSQTDDFQAKRLKAALKELVERYPQPSAERDPILLRVLGRECRNSEEMEPFRSMLHSPKSKCREVLHYFNGVAPSKHAHNGKTFDELGEHLDLVEPVLDIIKELAEPLPEEYQTLTRRTSREHNENETADGKFDYQELYAGGFVEKHITGIYASDNPETITDFGECEQTLQLAPDTKYIDEMYNKAGIDVCLYKELPQGGSWFTIYNPEAVESVSPSNSPAKS